MEGVEHEIEHHKQDQLKKKEEGKNHWKEELASDSESMVCSPPVSSRIDTTSFPHHPDMVNIFRHQPPRPHLSSRLSINVEDVGIIPAETDEQETPSCRVKHGLSLQKQLSIFLTSHIQ